MGVFGNISAYLEVLKPRATVLLTFIGVCTAIVAGSGQPPLGRLLAVGVAVLLVSAGANGLTNYLDREVDARMERTRHRALPSQRIYPPRKVLPLTIGLVVIGLALAGWLHWLAFVFGLAGTLASVLWRKRATCVFPQGVVAGCAPVLMGWWAIKPAFEWELLVLCALICVWIPLHVWSVMVANREDYLAAGLSYFPMSRPVRQSVRVLLILCLLLYLSSVVLYFIGGFAWLYLIAANGLGLLVVYAGYRLVASSQSRQAWRLYRLSAFPYLGIIFMVMCLDIWLIA
jgi:protoheme IX farnesyltransferase